MKWPLVPGITVTLALLAVPAGVASAQEGTLLDATRAGFVEVAEWIVKAAELVPEAQYGYRPAEAVRTFGQLVGHVADGNNWFCARAAGTPIEWAETVAQSGAGKTELIAQLRKSVDACVAAHAPANASRGGSLVANYGHASLHYGNIVTYLRMLGLTPPSS
jgi:uncharacterized damage-inducible protein DinB